MILCEQCGQYPAVIKSPQDTRYLCTVCLVDPEASESAEDT